MSSFYKSLLFAVLSFTASAALCQSQISGKVTDSATGEPIAGANILVKGKVVGTVTDVDGNFSLRVTDPPPFTLVFSFVGYRTIELPVASGNTENIEVKLEEQLTLADEIVVSASRVEERILESPVSIEKMDILEVRTTPSESYYKGLANLKGVDVTASSINFQILNARGFGSTGNTRFVQLIDGMDTQAPALNFPIGNLNGPSELDVESVELIPGASSALYGPNAFNGIVLITSKNPFEYQGLTAMAKLGVNHVGKNADFDGPSPVFDGAIRYAKVFGNKFALKVNASAMKAEDWHGSDTYDKERGRTPSSLGFNPGSDRLHFMGDEASINLAIFPFSSGWRVFARSGTNVFDAQYSADDYADDLPNHVVSLTPYKEEDLIDYGAENYKANAGLYYRITDKLELSALYNGGFGTSIYTGAQRYSLSNFSIQQGRIQLRGDNFFVRAYTTMENSGDSYITEFLAKRVNDLAVNRGNPAFSDVSGYLATYATEYIRHLYNEGLAPGDVGQLADNERINIERAAHNFARSVADSKFILDPSSAAFAEIKSKAMKGTVPSGPRFNDKTNLYHGEVQYDFKNAIDVVELQAGSSFRMFDLNSNGTIFDDKTENITIKEYGAYVQAGKWVADRTIKFSGSVRYDKNENFKGRVNPRIAAVIKAGENHNFRLSYQTGFRIPSTQGQHIDLNVLSSRLLGGLQRYADKYDIVRTSSTGQVLSFEGTSVQRFRQEIFATGNVGQAVETLVPFTKFNPVKPEQVRAIEVGYKSVVNNNFLLDLSYYYNIYNSFITQVLVVTAAPDPAGNPNYLTILNSNADNTFSIYTNAPGQVTAQGAVAGFTYNFLKGYTAGANYNWNKLGDVPEGFIAEFNTPEHKVNISFGNRKVTDRLGFNLTWRWQDGFDWQSSFTNYTLYPVPAYNTLDAQVSYRIPSLKSTFKLGGSNIFNQKYIMSGGGPNIGGLYYISVTFDELMR